jgi:hypothetical protein
MKARQNYLCVTCGTQFPDSEQPAPRCPICEDERQYVGWDGQQWTTLEAMREKYKNEIHEEEPGLFSIHTTPQFGIGQRALLVHTPLGNLLWDCVSLLDEPTIQVVRARGGLAAIAISHPHYYSSMVDWSRAFGDAPIYLHQADEQWVMRTDGNIQFWMGPTKPILDSLTLINTGGHFEGFQVLHWPAGAKQKGVLLAGDQPQVCADRRWVSFMYSYPNYIPLSPAAVRRVLQCLEPFTFDRLYGAFPRRAVMTDAEASVVRSAERYLGAVAN